MRISKELVNAGGGIRINSSKKWDKQKVDYIFLELNCEPELDKKKKKHLMYTINWLLLRNKFDAYSLMRSYKVMRMRKQ